MIAKSVEAEANIEHVSQILASEMTDDEFAVLSFRNLIYDICMQNGGGHGGSAVGMAAIGVALWKYVMRYNPADPEWFDRDRFVLSNGMALHHNNTKTLTERDITRAR